ncbi:hypothetical protein HMPREF0352_2072 [Enterococcus faecium TX1330]|nr:hypothetical protein HMPREF0352_2072 [Enterococcus faecium TX1330]SJX71660.1 hypothetical protein FM130_13110 [Enterococcus faecium]
MQVPFSILFANTQTKTLLSPFLLNSVPEVVSSKNKIGFTKI